MGQPPGYAPAASLILPDGLAFFITLLVTQLQNIEITLEASALADDRDAAVRWLADWRRTASELRGLLHEQSGVPGDLAEALQGSMTVSTRAKLALIETEGSVIDSTSAVRLAISNVTDLAGAYAGRIKAYSGENESL